MKEGQALTLNEFKMWLQGILEMQSDDWAPDAKQWARIRQKIEQITEPKPAPNVQAHPNVNPFESRPMAFPQQTGPQTQDHRPPAVPAGPSGLVSAPPIPQGPRAMLTQSGMPVTVTGGQPPRTKTPDIDTSHGNYDSNFV